MKNITKKVQYLPEGEKYWRVESEALNGAHMFDIFHAKDGFFEIVSAADCRTTRLVNHAELKKWLRMVDKNPELHHLII